MKPARPLDVLVQAGLPIRLNLPVKPQSMHIDLRLLQKSQTKPFFVAEHSPHEILVPEHAVHSIACFFESTIACFSTLQQF